MLLQRPAMDVIKLIIILPRILRINLPVIQQIALNVILKQLGLRLHLTMILISQYRPELTLEFLAISVM